MKKNYTSAIESLDDNELIAMAQSGDQRAYSVLWSKYKNFVNSVLKSKNLLAYPAWRKDVINEGKRGFVQAVKHFDTSRRNAFSTYAYDWILKYPLDFVRQLNRTQENQARISEETDSTEEPTAEMSSKKLDVEMALADLDQRDATVIRMYFGFDGQECSLEEIGAFLNLSRERVRQIRDRAFKLLRKPLGAYRLEAVKE